MSFDDILDGIKRWAPDSSKSDDIVDTLIDIAKYRTPMDFEDGLLFCRTVATNIWFNASEHAKKLSHDMIHDEHYHPWEERATVALQACSAEIQDKIFDVTQQEAIDWLKEVAAECDAIALLVSNREAATAFTALLRGDKLK